MFSLLHPSLTTLGHGTGQTLVAEVLHDPSGPRADDLHPTKHAVCRELLAAHGLMFEVVHELEQILWFRDAGRTQLSLPACLPARERGEPACHLYLLLITKR